MNIEEEKFKLDKKIREEELKLRWKEIELKEKEQTKRKLITPISATIITALLAFIASIITTYLSNSNQIDLERYRQNSSIMLSLAEKGDAEAIRLLDKFIEFGYIEDPDSSIRKTIDSGDFPVFKIPTSSTSLNNDGTALFKTKCFTCHSENNNRFASVESNVPNNEWIYKFIRNSDSLAESGDQKALEIMSENKPNRHMFQELSNEQIDAILDYVIKK